MREEQKNISFSNYFKAVILLLLDKKEPLLENFSFDNLNSSNRQHWLNELQNFNPIFKTIHYLTSRGVPCYPKKFDKTNFSGLKIREIKTPEHSINLLYSPDKFKKLFEESCAVTIPLEQAYKAGFVILDCDSPGLLFNNKDFKISERLFGMLVALYKQNQILLSSPTFFFFKLKGLN